MKISNLMKASFKIMLVFLIAITIVTINKQYNTCFCGSQTSKITQETIKVSQCALKYKHILEFKGLSGSSYTVELYIYSFKKSLLNQFIFNQNDSNIKYTTREVYNIFNHIFMNVYMDINGIKSYIEKELKDLKQLSDTEIKTIVDNFSQNAVNFILTKQALTRISLKSGDVVDINNLPISDFLVSGENTIQYINTLAQIMNEGKFIELIKYFSGMSYLNDITSGQNKIKLFENLEVTTDCLNYMYDLLPDLVDIYNSNLNSIKPKTNIVFSNVAIDKNQTLISKFITQSGESISKLHLKPTFSNMLSKSICEYSLPDLMESIKRDSSKK